MFWDKTTGSNVEKHRLYDGVNTLSYRYNAGTTYSMLHSGNFGNTAGTVTQGNDPRLSDARTPLSHDHDRLIAIDNRSIKPSDLGNNGGQIKPYFTSVDGLNGTQGGSYVDLMAFDTYTDGSGGNVNALVFHKDSRKITHYQAAKGSLLWGTPKTIPYSDGTHATGTWEINITGKSSGLGVYTWNPVIASTGLDYLFGRTSSDEIKMIDSTNVKSWLGLGSNAYTSTQFVPNQDGTRYNHNVNTLLTSGFYNIDVNGINNAPGQAYNQIIVAKGIDTGFQLAGGYMGDKLAFRGWEGAGSGFTSWRNVWHNGNFNPANYLPLTGGTLSGSVIVNNGFFQKLSNSAAVGLMSSSDALNGGSSTDFNAYVYGNNPFGIWTNGQKRVTISGSGNVDFTGTVTATDFIGISDIRLKENISILKPKPIGSIYKQYNFISDDKKQSRVGVIAQELELTNPEFVRTDSEGMKSISYQDLHSAEIAYLKAEVKRLSNLIKV